VDGIENLRTFVAVADTGSLVAAARHLRIAASVVTKRVDQLEARTHARLLARSTKRVVLTEFGTCYLPQARRLVHDYDEVLAEMSHSPREIEGHLRIRAPTPMAIAFMAGTFARFQRAYRGVSLDIVLTEGLSPNPADEGFDIVITGSTNSFAGVIDEPICPLNKWVCASPAYLERRGTPRHPRDLAKHDCLVFATVGSTWNFESATGPISVNLRPKLSANDQFVLTVAALRGNGIALLPSYAVASALRDGTLVRVLDRFTIPTVWIKAWIPEERAGLPKVRSLLAWLKAEYAPVPPWDRDL
jgi:DNA-binding transcriptional LysR family regulator